MDSGKGTPNGDRRRFDKSIVSNYYYHSKREVSTDEAVGRLADDDDFFFFFFYHDTIPLQWEMADFIFPNDYYRYLVCIIKHCAYT